MKAKTSKEIVLSFLKALNEEEFNSAQELLDASFRFEGPLGIRNNSKDYMQDMEKIKLKYEIEKVFEEGNYVSLFYKVSIAGQNLPTAGLYNVENGKLKSLRVLFDPRPVLEKKG
jgi:hypothetical protein